MPGEIEKCHIVYSDTVVLYNEGMKRILDIMMNKWRDGGMQVRQATCRQTH